MIADIVWLPAVIGIVINIFTSLNQMPLVVLEGTFMFIGILMASMLALLKIGYLATGDVIIMSILVLNPLYYVFIGAMVATVIITIHGFYLLLTKQVDTEITVKQFKNEVKWLPKVVYMPEDDNKTKDIDVPRDANNSREWVLGLKGITDSTMMKVSYGTPMVGYLGVSFVIGVLLWYVLPLSSIFPFLSFFTL
jgi:hypothetical protein